jgi:chaperonin GroEL
MLYDIGIATGATVISEEIGITLDTTEPAAVFGSCKKIIMTKDDTIIIEGSGRQDELEERIAALRDSIQQSTSEYDKEKLQERLGRLTGK